MEVTSARPFPGIHGGRFRRQALAAAAFLPAAAASAQQGRFTFTFVEVTAATNTPVPSPDGILEPGEAARIELMTTILPGIGAPATYMPPPAPGNGTIAGLGSVFFSLRGSNNIGGTWSFLNRDLAWRLGSAGLGNPDGSLDAAQAGQFVLPGMVANSTNPIPAIWSGVWTPASYLLRDIEFHSIRPPASEGAVASLILQYGVDPETGTPLYVAPEVQAFHGQVNIPIVPAPAATFLTLLLPCIARRRRR